MSSHNTATSKHARQYLYQTVLVSPSSSKLYRTLNVKLHPLARSMWTFKNSTYCARDCLYIQKLRTIIIYIIICCNSPHSSGFKLSVRCQTVWIWSHSNTSALMRYNDQVLPSLWEKKWKTLQSCFSHTMCTMLKRAICSSINI